MLNKLRVQKVLKITKVVGIVFGYLYFTHILSSNYLADIYASQAEQDLADYQLPKALQNADEAVTLNPLEPNYYRIRARVYTNYLAKEPAETRDLLKNIIVRDLTTAYSLNPYNLVTMRNSVPLYYFIAAENIMLPASAENVDVDYLPLVRDFYRYVKNYSPNDVGVYALLAKYEKRLGLTAEYDESVARVKELRPDLLDWYESFR